MKRCYILTFFAGILFTSVPNLFAQQSESEPSVETWIRDTSSIRFAETKNVVTDFKNDLRKLDQLYADAFEKRRAELIEKLENAKKSATLDEKLDVAIQIRNAIDSLPRVQSTRPTSTSIQKGKKSEEKPDTTQEMCVGKWYVRWDNKKNSKVEIKPDSTIIVIDENKQSKLVGKLTEVDGGLTVYWPTIDCQDLITPANGKLLYQQWFPAKRSGNSPPTNFGYGVPNVN